MPCLGCDSQGGSRVDTHILGGIHLRDRALGNEEAGLNRLVVDHGHK